MIDINAVSKENAKSEKVMSDKKISYDLSSECCDPVVSDDVKGSARESRLTNIIDQLRGASKNKGYGPQQQRHEVSSMNKNGEAGGGGVRRCVRDAASPAHAAAHPSHTLPAAQSLVKTERLSPHDNTSSASRSRSVTPSTSSYPGTPPERGSPHAPQPPNPAQPPRNYSDIMRSLAARYNTPHNNEYFHRLNGFTNIEARTAPQTSPVRSDSDPPLGGLFTRLAKHQGGPSRLPAFPAMVDMSCTKTLLAISRASKTGRLRRKRVGATTSGAEHSPLDLSAATEQATKRARLSVSPSNRSEFEDNIKEERSDCMCSEARARLSAWTVDEVCDFVNSIDICAEYASNFREQRIDGAGLPLLTEDHLTGMLQMKLGPALKLRAVLAKKLEPCAACQVLSSPPSIATNVKMNGSLKSEPRSNTTSPS